MRLATAEQQGRATVVLVAPETGALHSLEELLGEQVTSLVSLISRFEAPRRSIARARLGSRSWERAFSRRSHVWMPTRVI